MMWRGSVLPSPTCSIRMRLRSQTCRLTYGLWLTSIAQALQKAQRPLVISGASCNSMAIIQAAANVARALVISRASRRAQFHRAGVQQLRTGPDGGRVSEPSV